MWNTYLNKAKAFAETIDQQINDSVGIEEGNTGGTTSTTITSTAVDDIAADLDDNWNDDDDDLYVSDDDNNKQQQQQSPPIPPSQPQQQEEQEQQQQQKSLLPPAIIPSTSGLKSMFSTAVEAIEEKIVVTPKQQQQEEEPTDDDGNNNNNNNNNNDAWANDFDDGLDEIVVDDEDEKVQPPDHVADEEKQQQPQHQQEEQEEQEQQLRQSQDEQITEENISIEQTAKNEEPELSIQEPPPTEATTEEEEDDEEVPTTTTPVAEEEIEKPVAESSGWEDEMYVNDNDIVVDEQPTETEPILSKTEEEVVEQSPLLQQEQEQHEKQQPEPETELEPQPTDSPTLEPPPVVENDDTNTPSLVVETSLPASFTGSIDEDEMNRILKERIDNEINKLKQSHCNEILRMKEEHQMTSSVLQSQLEDALSQVKQRENQLAGKSEQITTMQEMNEQEKETLRNKVRETKEEAKKRILRAKERVEEMEKRLASATQAAGSAGEQAEVITALREEGEKLARKQSEMEQLVRSAKGETRELSSQLENEVGLKDQALEKIANLEAELKRTKEDLKSAQKGESLTGKLEGDLSSAREEIQMKEAANLSLQQEVKELKQASKELNEQLEEEKKEAQLEKTRTSKLLKREHSELVSDLETKIRSNEREANVREDALRHEVSEIRKRWQDAVRRADTLSMDVQTSTAPLMRQLESTERQNRARAAAWAELETKLRADLEDNVIQNEKLSKERNELRSNLNRVERLSKEYEAELSTAKATVEEQASKIKKLEDKLTEMETEGQKMKEEWVEVERLANEGVSKVRSDMMQTVMESEERYRSQIATLEEELSGERQKRIGFENQLQNLVLESAGMGNMVYHNAQETASTPRPVKEKKLIEATEQTEILSGALSGLDDYDDEEENDDDIDAEVEQPKLERKSSGFAAMEELTQRLKQSTAELKTLRKELEESEKARESLATELGEARQASEKLPLFEAKVQELMQENKEKELEIMGLREDMIELKQVFQSQLNTLMGVEPEPTVTPPTPEKESDDETSQTLNGDDASPSENGEEESQ